MFPKVKIKNRSVNISIVKKNAFIEEKKRTAVSYLLFRC